MARISIIMLPIPGHLFPVVPVATRLLRKGHHVNFCAPPSWGHFLTSRGFSFSPLPFAEFPSTEGYGNIPEVHPTALDLKRLAEELIRDSNLNLDELLCRAVDSTAPDLVVCDSFFGPSTCEALRNQLRRAVIALSPLLSRERPDWTVREIVLCPWELEIPGFKRVAMTRSYAEPSVFRDFPENQFQWEFLNAHRSLVLCSFGTQVSDYPEAASVVESIITVFREKKNAGVVIIAGNRIATCTSDLPSNIVVVPSAPQAMLLEHADLFITHAGIGSIKEGIMSRVPMLAIPFRYDQHNNAGRLEWHGLGRSLTLADRSPHNICDASTALMEAENIRENLAKMSRIFWSRELERPSGSLIEDLLPA